ncbi:MAG: type V CRISPR-associated protein Cas12a/Cpf1 [Bacteroidaceae bacterium]|nr:type V CRISPR-associated protein Cas12a/Cpf1 [Bacteroidaceae bacterium]
MKDLKQFIDLYPVSKTLRFELRPVGRTQEWIEKNHVLENDGKRAEDYPRVKDMIDTYHKTCINESLDDVVLDWTPLRDAIERNRQEKSDESKKALEEEQTKMRKKICEKLASFKHYQELVKADTPSKLISGILPHDKTLDTFNKFAVYFEGFQENRRNIYSNKAISTSVAYRLVHDNFPKFLANIEVFENIRSICPDVINQVADEMAPFLEGVMIEDVFTVSYYNSVLTQNGIDYYNRILGGVAKDGQKYPGINELTNDYMQHHPELGAKRKSLTMVPLFKQILSDRETLSDIVKPIESEEQLIRVINNFYHHITNFTMNGNNVNVVKELTKMVLSLDQYNPDGIFVSAKALNELSHSLYGNWNRINEKLYDKAVEMVGDIQTAKNKKKVEAYLNKEAYSLSEISFNDGTSIFHCFSALINSADSINSLWLQFQNWCKTAERPQFVHNEVGTEFVKKLLDAIMLVLHKCGTLVVSLENNLDSDFYNKYLPFYAELENVILVYTRVRNFLTKKLSDTGKIKLKFDTPSLGAGWGINKEKTNKAILLFKDGLSYLGIMNVRGTLDFNCKIEVDEPTFKKMVCRNYSKPYMDLPNSFFSQNGINKYQPSERIQKIYLAFKQNSKNVDIKKVRELIDYYKDAISRHEDWGSFGFKYSPTESYETINDFYTEVAAQSYRLSFIDVPQKQVDEWVESGQLYLFQLFNKDYAEGAHGRKNLHTLYWESIFSEENLDNLFIKLGGQAELFYRPQSIKNPVSHKVGTKMLNRRGKDGKPIPDAIYRSLYQYFNGKKTEAELTAEEKAYISQTIVKDVHHEIIKDRRYTKQFFYQFHVPIVFNANAPKRPRVNERVLEYIKENPDVNIIGIDRGERHLIYLSLINQRGEILKQKTFNVVGDYDYQEKLKQRENERDQAQKSWQSVGKIKDLKEGFLSAVVHEIAKMIIEYNAIVVLEDLNRGFKRGRFKVERQVYQKFEKMLIDKLNYLSFKDVDIAVEGGILRGYQLTEEAKNYTDIGKQTGFLFYIPAAYTSKIDPVTGFVNHFNLNDITNAEKRKDFFMKMERIEMKDGNIEFEFDYRKFKTYQTDFQNVWTVNTSGKRIVFDTDTRKAKDVHPTKEIVQAFANKGITLEDGMDIKALIEGIGCDAKNASLFSSLLYAFKTTLQMRNSNADTKEDYIHSPIVRDGKQFCTTDEMEKGKDADGNWISRLPVDADANGAYHIALKGLYLLLKPQVKKIENEKWLQFMYEKEYRK